MLVYSLLRRRLSQYKDISGSSKRPDLKAGNLLMSKDIRTNKSKKIGHVHYMTDKLSSDNDPVPVTIVSAVLIYTDHKLERGNLALAKVGTVAGG
ncbi:hypothetical protein LIER_15096 [Lithospermum erythrorhizon]|uniref:Uncharacterized protein n=1 Tax=Lithospermum erythrorhizon TaxID=34254 RepID=A0AAV3Q316_LITER